MVLEMTLEFSDAHVKTECLYLLWLVAAKMCRTLFDFIICAPLPARGSPSAFAWKGPAASEHDTNGTDLLSRCRLLELLLTEPQKDLESGCHESTNMVILDMLGAVGQQTKRRPTVCFAWAAASAPNIWQSGNHRAGYVG